MEINRVVSGVLHNNTYIITNDKDTFIIDANANADMIRPYLKGKNVKGILITHAHFDHIFSIENLLKEFDCKCFIHKNGVEKFTSVELNCSYFFDSQTFDVPEDKIQIVQEGDIIDFGQDKITVVELPGHTDCGLGFVVGQNMFCGDTIFSGGCGRCDLATSNKQDIFNSINKVYNNYNNYTLYSGHGQEFRVNK